MQKRTNRFIKRYIIHRLIAGLIDYTLWVTLFWLSLELFGEKGNEGGYSSDYAWYFFFGLWIGLMIITELIFQSTIGNYIFGLKVIREDGNRIKFWQSIIRHCLDMFDMWPFGLVGILTIRYTKRNQRLGDLLARTIVTHKSAKI